jgi:hypothetical protein
MSHSFNNNLRVNQNLSLNPNQSQALVIASLRMRNQDMFSIKDLLTHKKDNSTIWLKSVRLKKPNQVSRASTQSSMDSLETTIMMDNGKKLIAESSQETSKKKMITLLINSLKMF